VEVTRRKQGAGACVGVEDDKLTGLPGGGRAGALGRAARIATECAPWATRPASGIGSVVSC